MRARWWCWTLLVGCCLLLLGAGEGRAATAAPGSATALRATSLRGRPKGGAPPLARVKKSHTVEVLEEVGPWLRVRLADGRQGWLARKHMQVVRSPTRDLAPAAPESSPESPAAAPATTSEPECAGARCAEASAASSARTARGRPLRVAVYTLEAKGQEGIPQRTADLVTDSLVAEVRKLQRISTIGMSEIQDMLSHAEAQRMLGCEADACLIEIGGALGVDLILTGSLGQLGESNLLNLRLIDVSSMEVAGRVNRRLKGGDGEEFLEAVGPAVQELFPEHALRPGFRRGAAPEMARRLNPPPLSPVWFWVTSGAAVTLAAGGIGFGLATRASQDDWDELAQRSRDPNSGVSSDELARVQDRLESRAAWANGLLLLAGVVAAGAGVEALYTDWQGYGEATNAARPVAWRSHEGAVLVGLAGGW